MIFHLTQYIQTSIVSTRKPIKMIGEGFCILVLHSVLGPSVHFTWTAHLSWNPPHFQGPIATFMGSREAWGSRGGFWTRTGTQNPEKGSSRALCSPCPLTHTRLHDFKEERNPPPTRAPHREPLSASDSTPRTGCWGR